MRDMLATITAHYLLFTFLTSLGLLQLAGARSKTRHLLLLDSVRASAALGVVLLIAGYSFFLEIADYGLPGLEGAQLFFEFLLTAIAALLVCAGANVARSGHIGASRRALRRRIAASVVELRPLFARRRQLRVEDEAT